MVPINTQHQFNAYDQALRDMANTEKTLASNRAQALGALIAGSVAVVVIIIGITLGFLGVLTVTEAIILGVTGGFLGGIVIGALVGGAFYVIKMWNSTSWGIPPKS